MWEDCVGHIRSGQVTVGVFSELQVRVSPTCLSDNDIYAFSYPRKSRVLPILMKGMYFPIRYFSKCIHSWILSFNRVFIELLICG